MVVIAAAICTKSGKVLVSRQFVDISRSRIGALLTAFPRLAANSSKQYTYLDGLGVRFVYQPIEDLYTVLVTNNTSNIVEDIETLQLINVLVSEKCGVIDEDSVIASTFELIFALDEVISMGYREKVTQQQIRQFLEMDSQEEKMAEIVQQNQEREAAKESKRRGREIEKKRREASRAGGISSQDGNGGYKGKLSNNYIGDNDSFITKVTSSNKIMSDAKLEGQNIQHQSSGKYTNMTLNLKNSTSQVREYLDTMRQELAGQEKTVLNAAASNKSVLEVTTSMNGYNGHQPSIMESVHISMSEKINVRMDKDGNLNHLEVLGELDIFVNNEEYRQVTIQLLPNQTGSALHFKLHPNLNKQDFLDNGLIQLRDSNRSFVVNAPNALLKWRLVSRDFADLPLLVQCWSTYSQDSTALFNLEYEATGGIELQDLVVSVPIVAKTSPRIIEVDGEAHFNAQQSTLEWRIALIDSSNASGHLDFEMDQWRPEDIKLIYPINVTFSSNSSMFKMKVINVSSPKETNVGFSSEVNLNVGSYTIEST